MTYKLFDRRSSYHFNTCYLQERLLPFVCCIMYGIKTVRLKPTVSSFPPFAFLMDFDVTRKMQPIRKRFSLPPNFSL